MPGSHSLKYYAKSFKKVKFNHTTLESYLKDQEVKILPTKLMKLKTFRMSYKQSKKIY